MSNKKVIGNSLYETDDLQNTYFTDHLKIHSHIHTHCPTNKNVFQILPRVIFKSMSEKDITDWSIQSSDLHTTNENTDGERELVYKLWLKFLLLDK